MTDTTQPPVACEHGIRAPWQCHDCDAANPPPPGYDPLASTQPPAETLAWKPLPCPFCGEKAHIEDGQNDRPWVIQCVNSDCPAQPFMDHADTRREAVQAWNTRAALTRRAGGDAIPAMGEGERVRHLVEQIEAGQFDALEAVADRWAASAGVQQMSAAIASVFEQHASQEIMDRFREKVAALMHLAFVEGAAQGVLQVKPVLNAGLRNGTAPMSAPTRWRPIETAPRDGSWFFTKVEGADDYPYDVAQFDPEFGDFAKAGCGFSYVTHWRPAEETGGHTDA